MATVRRNMKKIYTILFFLIVSVGWSSSLTPPSSFTPYGPGNPEPVSAWGVTGIMADWNPDASTARVGNAVTYMTDTSGNGYGATVVSSSVDLQNIYGNHYLYHGISNTGTTAMLPVTININSSMSVTLNNFSFYEVFMPTQCLGNYWFMLGTAATHYIDWTDYNGTSGLFFGQTYSDTTAARVNSKLTMPSGMSFFGVSNGAVSTVISVNNQNFDSVTNLPATVYSGGSFWDFNGSTQQGNPGYMARAVLINHQLSDQELAILKNHLISLNYAPGFLAPNPKALVLIGDSIPGHNINNGKPYEVCETEHLNFPVQAYDVATSGVTLAYIKNSGVTVVAPLVSAYGQNGIFQVEGGTNDLLAGQTAAQVWLSAMQTCATYRNTYNWPVFYDNIIPGNSNNATTVTNTNTLLSSPVSGLVAWGAADNVVNVSTDGRITRASDNTHPTTAAQPFYGEDNWGPMNQYFFLFQRNRRRWRNKSESWICGNIFEWNRWTGNGLLGVCNAESKCFCFF